MSGPNRGQVEVWKPVKGFEGHYEVSNLGRVKSLARSHRTGFGIRHRPEVIMSISPMRHGYLLAKFSVDDVQTYRTVHSLVAEAFIGPRPKGLDVAHNNGDKTDNRVENLRYATRSENNLDWRKHGLERRTTCRKGHEFTPENTTWVEDVHGMVRRCVTCAQANHARKMAAQRERRRLARIQLA